PADVKCLGFLYLYVGRYPRNNASRNTQPVENQSNPMHRPNMRIFIFIIWFTLLPL
ncbi:MAG: hypothetical protein BECKG1743E_GA0114224_112732, partial [Candidatus Kentron sp. G]